MKNNNSNNSGGIGIVGLLGVAFIVLKLTDFIDWSWWYVTLPFWGGAAVIMPILVIMLIFKSLNSNDKPKYYEHQNTHKSNFKKRLDDAMEKRDKNKQS